MAERKYDSRLTADVVLEFPVEVDGLRYDKLTMRRPKTKDSLNAAKVGGTEVDRAIWLMATLCGVPPEVILEMDEVDSEALGEQYQSFKARRSAS